MGKETKFEKAVDNIGAFIILILIAVVSMQVISRYVFRAPLPWSEEIARYFMVWATMIGSAMAMRTKEHIRIETFVKKLSAKTSIIYKYFHDFVVALFLVLLLYYGYRFSLLNSSQTSPAMPWLNMFWIAIAVPIGSGLMLIYLIKDFFRTIPQLKDTNKGNRGELY